MAPQGSDDARDRERSSESTRGLRAGTGRLRSLGVILLTLGLTATLAWLATSTGSRGGKPEQREYTDEDVRRPSTGSAMPLEAEPVASATSEEAAGTDAESQPEVASGPRTGTIKGEVRDQFRKGVPGIRVLASRISRARGESAEESGRRRAAARTDGDGKFELTVLGLGKWMVRVDPAEFGEVIQHAEGRYCRRSLLADQLLVYAPLHVFRIPDGADRSSFIIGRVVDPSGEECGGARVIYSDRDPDLPSRRRKDVTTSNRGRFVIGPLEPEGHYLQAWQSQYRPSETCIAYPGGEDQLLVLREELYIEIRPIRPDGGLLEEVSFSLREPGADQHTSVRSCSLRPSEQLCRLSWVQPGVYEIRLLADKAWYAFLRVELESEPVLEEVVLEPAATIEVRVRSARYQAGVTWGYVRVLQDGAVILSDSVEFRDGKGELRLAAPPGEVTVEIDGPRRQQARREVKCTSGEITFVDLSFE